MMKESFRPVPTEGDEEKKTTPRKATNAFATGLAAGGMLVGVGALKVSSDHVSRTEQPGKMRVLHDQPDQIGQMILEMGKVPINGFDKSYFSEDELKCLTDNLYHEARGEPKQGRYGVIFATLERVLSKKFPHSICGVVHQPWQFSWTKDEKILAAPIHPKEYLQMAVEVYELVKGRTLEEASVEAGLRAGLPRGSIYYKDARFTGSEKVQKFFATLQKVAQIGTHEFFIAPERVLAQHNAARKEHGTAPNVVPLPPERPQVLKAEDAKNKKARKTA